MLANPSVAIVVAVLVIEPSGDCAAVGVSQVMWPESVDRPLAASAAVHVCFYAKTSMPQEKDNVAQAGPCHPAPANVADPVPVSPVASAASCSSSFQG